MKEQKLPDTDSIEELARFWDTHDLTAFEDQLEEVSKPVFVRGKGAPLSIDEATLLRQWIVERLHEASVSKRAPDKTRTNR